MPTIGERRTPNHTGCQISQEDMQKKKSNVLNYGAVASTASDIGPALTSAFEAFIDGGTGLISYSPFAENRV